jgi:hypothetical protein
MYGFIFDVGSDVELGLSIISQINCLIWGFG